MRTRVLIFSFLLLLSHLLVAQDSEWSAVEKALGRTGKIFPGAVIKFGMPRKDLDVRLGNVRLEAPFALGSWVAFQGSPVKAMLMGDLVLTEAELQPVIAKLVEGGVQISAIHNHVVGETPRVMYVHIGGHGDAVPLASTLRSALALTKTPAAASSAQATKLSFDRAAIESALGLTGNVVGDVLQFSVPRPEAIEQAGMKIAPSMGTGIAINFESAPNGEIATTGDFVLPAGEVNNVIHALKQNGIEVTALHNHMLDEIPRLFFLHFWGVGKPATIASAMKSALRETAAGKK